MGSIAEHVNEFLRTSCAALFLTNSLGSEAGLYEPGPDDPLIPCTICFVREGQTQAFVAVRGSEVSDQGNALMPFIEASALGSALGSDEVLVLLDAHRRNTKTGEMGDAIMCLGWRTSGETAISAVAYDRADDGSLLFDEPDTNRPSLDIATPLFDIFQAMANAPTIAMEEPAVIAILQAKGFAVVTAEELSRGTQVLPQQAWEENKGGGGTWEER